MYQLTAAAASDTINITERAGRAEALLIVVHYVTAHYELANRLQKLVALRLALESARLSRRVLLAPVHVRP